MAPMKSTETHFNSLTGLYVRSNGSIDITAYITEQRHRICRWKEIQAEYKVDWDQLKAGLQELQDLV